MGTYYPNSSAQLDILSASYDCDQNPLLHGNMMMYLNPATSVNPQTVIEIPSMTARNEMMQSMSNEISIVEGEQNLQTLSLSLSTQMSTAVSTPSFQFQYSNPGLSSVFNPHLPLSAENSVRPMASKIDESSPSKDVRNSDYFSYDIRFGAPNNPHYEQVGVGSTILKSKYLKVVQLLLDEVVNLEDALWRTESGKEKNSNKVDEDSNESKGGPRTASEADESAAGSGSSHEISPAEKQDLQNKLDKLQSLLDEVDTRYRQYCHQMQILVSSFDMVAGGGAAKPYTALALKTISRHFRCLRDAITAQIHSTRKSLGEQDNGLGSAIPRLRYVDQQVRQQRALQQFGMMRHAWRPQRGLPETAVTVLRAWLFEHFLHPYPKDSEKIMLARQTGLTRSQVANWFINARVRLWKPMVEEMYKEEFGGDVDINPRCSPENTPKTVRDKSWGCEEMQEYMAHDSHDFETNANHGSDMKGSTSPSASDPIVRGHHLTTSAYQMSDVGNFNQVSLALGLRHREGDHALPLSSGTAEAPSIGFSTSEYPYLDQLNQQHRFGNTHILNDFVA